MKGYLDITSSDNDTFSRTDTTIFTKVLVVPILNTQVVMPVDKNKFILQMRWDEKWLIQYYCSSVRFKLRQFRELQSLTLHGKQTMSPFCVEYTTHDKNVFIQTLHILQILSNIAVFKNYRISYFIAGHDSD